MTKYSEESEWLGLVRLKIETADPDLKADLIASVVERSARWQFSAEEGMSMNECAHLIEQKAAILQRAERS